MVSANKSVKLSFLLGLLLGIFSMVTWNKRNQVELKVYKQKSAEKDVELNLLQIQKIAPEMNLSSTSSNTTTIIQLVTCPPHETGNKDAIMHSVEVTHKERQMTLLNACRRLNDNCLKLMTKPQPKSLYSKKYKFSICDIRKSASSSWLKTVLVMEGYYPVKAHNEIKGAKAVNIGNTKLRLKSFGNDAIMQRNWNQSLNIITVRDPFHRLVSAYNDKMRPEGRGFSYTYGPWSRRINKEFRHLRHNEEDRNRTDDGTATFEDFVNFLVHSKQPDRRDGHWLSYDLSCSPCVYKYDVITKFETMNEDMLYLKNYLNISEEDRKAFFPEIWLPTNDKTVKEYFKQIPFDLAKSLYEQYKGDFELFGYEIPSWLC